MGRNRPGTTRDTMDRDDVLHCRKLEDHAPHPHGIWWCTGGSFAAPGATRLPAEPDTRTRKATAADETPNPTD